MKDELKKLIDSGARVTFSWDEFTKSVRIDAIWPTPGKRCGCMITQEEWEYAEWQPKAYLTEMLRRILDWNSDLNKFQDQLTVAERMSEK